MIDDCNDRLFRLDSDSLYEMPIWEGYAGQFTAGMSGGGFKDVLIKLINQGAGLKPGPYTIIRLDRSIRKDALPLIAWLGMVTENMAVKDDLDLTPVQRMTRWPPK